MPQIPLAFGQPTAPKPQLDPQRPLTVAGLFAGIGGIEAGLHRAGHSSALLCEIDPVATAVLRERFPGVAHHGDVTSLDELPEVDLLAAGFPCQDLSISGQRAGITGRRSSLVSHVFRLIDQSNPSPKWLLLENVPFMLQLQNGRGMNHLIEELENRGFAWAYRVIDTKAFGLPHRRHRVLLLASKSDDPKHVLLGADALRPNPPPLPEAPVRGFYWTEGHRGIGWSEECVPPIKVGSGLGIPSSPAIWDPTDGSMFTLDIRDIERLQGFEADWTQPAERLGRRAERWRLVGNSVSVPLGEWIGSRLRDPTAYDSSNDPPLRPSAKWPNAAWGDGRSRRRSAASMWPVSKQLPLLRDFLVYPVTPLSSKAAAGLLKRLENGSTIVPPKFLADLKSLSADEQRRVAGAESRKLERQISTLRAAVQRATQFADRVELNEKLRALKLQLAHTRTSQ